MRVPPGIVVGCAPVFTCLLTAPLAAQAHWSAEVAFSSRIYTAAAYDAARGETVLFGGSDGIYRDQTWVWAGSGWTLRTPTQVPPARIGHRMVYDSVRQRVVMFHGVDGNGERDDMWSWNGSDWTAIGSAAAVPHYSVTAVTYDAARDRIVLWGGEQNLGHLWEYDGSAWAEIPIAATWPPLQSMPPLAFDGSTDTVALYTVASTSVMWRWNGTTWSQQPVASSVFSGGGCMVYDPVGNRLLLAGGTGGPGTLLQWDGAAPGWQVLTSGGPVMVGPHCVFDVARSRVVLIGERGLALQVDSSVWESDGGAWQLLGGATPTGRYRPVMTYDLLHDRLYLYGGKNGGNLGDLWEHEAGGWRLLVPQIAPSTPGPTHPGSLDGARLVYDEARDELLLLAGDAESVFPFYRLVGEQWQRIDVPTPGPRATPGVVYDRQRQRVVMFGGNAGSFSNLLDETWTWDGVAWQQLLPAHTPPPRREVSMAYDPVRDRVVLVGGFLPEGLQGATWEFDGEDWRLVAAAPTTTAGMQAAFDEQRQAVVALNYAPTTSQFETWQWFGAGWSRIAIGDDAPMHVEGTLAADGDGLLLFGGRGSLSYLVAPLHLRGDMLADAVAFGVGGATSAGELQLLPAGYRPWLGSGFPVRMQPLPPWSLPGLWLGLSDTEWAGVALPLDLAVLGNPGNQLYVALDGIWPILDALDGTAVATVTIPPTTTLLGAVVFAQGFVFEALSGELATSNALRMTLGTR